MRTKEQFAPEGATHYRIVPATRCYLAGFLWYKVIDGVAYKPKSLVAIRLKTKEWKLAKLSKATKEQLIKL